MRLILLIIAGTAAAAWADDGAEAQRIFETRCASCHTVPDPGLRGDRAWLGQVPKTA